MARLRSVRLWPLFPVKYWSAAPYSSSATTRRSTRTPFIQTLVFVGPKSMVSPTRSHSVSARPTASPSSLAASTSTSPMVGFQRRSDPPTSARSTASWRRTNSLTASPTGRASPSSSRSWASRANATPERMFCSVFSPNPDTSRISPASAAASRSSSVWTPSSSYSVPTVFGPTPSTAVSSSTSTGSFSRSASSSSISPVSKYSTIFDAMDSPTPFIRCTASTSSLARSSTGSGWFLTLSAARRYVFGL